MPLPDISQSFDSAKSKLGSIKTFTEVSKSGKELSSKAADSITNLSSELSSQLNQISEVKKRFQSEAKTSMDQLLDLISIGQGGGSSTIRYIRRKILEASIKIEPKVEEILLEEVLKVVGCDKDQSYLGSDQSSLITVPLPQRSQSEGIYIPVKNIDLFSMLKNSTEDQIGKVLYEKDIPSSDTKFRPYGGTIPFPMNRQLRYLMDEDNLGRSFRTIHGDFYQGGSLRNIFDIQYSSIDQFGVSGDYFRVMMINRGNGASSINNVAESIIDYYKTIRILDSVDITTNIVNLLSNAIDIKVQPGYGDLENKTKFNLILERILGLCFDSRSEIDVSGTAKIGELDGVDDSFYELSEIDLRFIDTTINNIQNGVIEFEDCDNVKLPIDSELLVNELIKFRESIEFRGDDEKILKIEEIIDSIYNNPDWDGKLPSSFNLSISVDTNVIKKIPLAIASSILSPKVLLPLYTFLHIVKNLDKTELTGNLNEFLKQFKSFTIQIVSRINEVFLKQLFEILKKDIINLISLTLTDISRSRLLKKYSIIIKLLNLALIISKSISDFRKCKSLLDEIFLLLNLISGGSPRIPGLPGGSSIGGREIPLPLLALTPLLPGYSPERASINIIENLQRIGVPTGPMPDGSPNLMMQFNLAMTKGIDKEMSENGKVEMILDPRLPIAGFGKMI
jgi:hypothetical protein